MSGSRAMPQPCTPRLVIPSPPRTGSRYSPSVHATESPMIATRGSVPGRRPGRAVGGTGAGLDAVPDCGAVPVGAVPLGCGAAGLGSDPTRLTPDEAGGGTVT